MSTIEQVEDPSRIRDFGATLFGGHWTGDGASALARTPLRFASATEGRQSIAA